MPDRKGTAPPRLGPHRRSADVGAKARAFPTGAARDRLRLAFWPRTIEDEIARWLRPGKPPSDRDGRDDRPDREATGPGLARESRESPGPGVED